eukprot:332204-Rhodomonas_salina.2
MGSVATGQTPQVWAAVSETHATRAPHGPFGQHWRCMRCTAARPHAQRACITQPHSYRSQRLSHAKPDPNTA